MDQHEIRKELRDSMKNFIGFYNNLAYLSGGAVVLSITYLGYLKSVDLQEKIISNEWILITSWIYFLLTLLSSIIRNEFHMEYIHLDPIRYLGKPDPKNLLEKKMSRKQLIFSWCGTFSKVCFFGGLLFLTSFAIKTGTNFLD